MIFYKKLNIYICYLCHYLLQQIINFLFFNFCLFLQNIFFSALKVKIYPNQKIVYFIPKYTSSNEEKSVCFKNEKYPYPKQNPSKKTNNIIQQKSKSNELYIYKK